jgi:hypothetical protein
MTSGNKHPVYRIASGSHQEGGGTSGLKDKAAVDENVWSGKIRLSNRTLFSPQQKCNKKCKKRKMFIVMDAVLGTKIRQVIDTNI